MPKSAYALVTRTRRQIKSTKPREAILGDGNGNIYSNGQYLVRYAGPADANGNVTYGPVSQVYGGQANFLEKPNRHVYIAPNHKGQPVITGPVWEDMQQAGIKPSVIHPNTAYRQFQRLKDIQNFKAVIYNPDGLRVSIRELVYIDGRDGTLQIWLGTDESNHVDLEPSLPVTPGHHCYALISFSQDLYAAASYPLVVTTSTSQAIGITLDATDRQEALDAMTPDAFPIQFFRLTSGQTGLGIGDPYDLDVRQLINVPRPIHYQTIQGDTVDAPQQPILNFESSGSVDVTVTDDPSNNRTNVLIEAVAGAGTDTTAIHDNVAGEIAAITTKTTPVNADYLLIEDSAASDAKKKITIGSLKQGYALLEDHKTSGTGGGGYTAGADQTRTLNTTVVDTIGLTLSSNKFTLPPGDYRLEVTAPAQNVNYHQLVLWCDTGGAGTIIKRGQQTYTAGNIPTFSHLTHHFTVATSIGFEIRHRCTTTNAGSAALGVPGGFGTEVYTSVEIIRE